jgi:hypothetical protein
MLAKLRRESEVGVRYMAMETRRALPYALIVWWLCSSPVALLFAARIMWEKTVWTWARGPQMVGFSLMHIHPALAITGMLGCLALMVWLLPAIFYAVERRESIGVSDISMIACAAFVVFVIVIPDTFFT